MKEKGCVVILFVGVSVGMGFLAVWAVNRFLPDHDEQVLVWMAMTAVTAAWMYLFGRQLGKQVAKCNARRSELEHFKGMSYKECVRTIGYSTTSDSFRISAEGNYEKGNTYLWKERNRKYDKMFDIVMKFDESKTCVFVDVSTGNSLTVYALVLYPIFMPMALIIMKVMSNRGYSLNSAAMWSGLIVAGFLLALFIAHIHTLWAQKHVGKIMEQNMNLVGKSLKEVTERLGKPTETEENKTYEQGGVILTAVHWKVKWTNYHIVLFFDQNNICTKMQTHYVEKYRETAE